MANNTQQAPDFLEKMLNVINVLSDDRQSLAEVGDMATLTPMIMFGRDLYDGIDTETIHNINQMHLSVYSALYLKAASLILPKVANIQDITVEEILAPLSDRRTRVTHNGILNDIGEFILDLTLESGDGLLEAQLQEYKDSKLISNKGILNTFDAENYNEADLSKPSNLGVGKLIYVPISIGGKEYKQPVTVRANPNVFDTDFMNQVILAFIGKDKSIMGRLRQYNENQIEGAGAYALGLDLISEDRKLRLKDKDGIYALVKENRTKGRIDNLVAGKKTDYNVASNAFCVSSTSLRQIETNMRGKFSRFQEREKVLRALGCMMFSVVDSIRETITVYTIGQEQPAVLHLSDLKNKSASKEGKDINEMLRALKLGESFSL